MEWKLLEWGEEGADLTTFHRPENVKAHTLVERRREQAPEQATEWAQTRESRFS